MKQRLFSRLFIVLPAALCLSMISIGSAFAADPVTIRYEVASYQTSLGFVTCYDEDGPRTELLSEGTTTWSYQFSTANMGQLVSVYPVPVDNPNTTISLVSKVYINDVLYRTVTGHNASTASIHDTLGNLLNAGRADQWAIKYEISTEQTTLGLVTYSNNHTSNQSEILAADTTAWNYQYTTSNANQPIKIEAIPMIPNDSEKYYTVVIKVFVNNDLRYYATFNPSTLPATVDIKLSDLPAGRAQQALQSLDENSGVPIISEIVPNQVQIAEAAVTPSNPIQAAYVFKPKQIFGDPGGFRTTSFSFSTNDRYISLTFVTSPQPVEVPNIVEPSSSLLALVPQQ